MELLKATTPSDLEVLVPHRNAPLTVVGRRRLCLRVDAGRPRAHVAAEAGGSRQCLSKWHARWAREGEAGLADRSSHPQASPRRFTVELEDRIEQIRRDRKLGPARVAFELAREGLVVSASGVRRVLERVPRILRAGCGRPVGCCIAMI